MKRKLTEPVSYEDRRAPMSSSEFITAYMSAHSNGMTYKNFNDSLGRGASFASIRRQQLMKAGVALPALTKDKPGRSLDSGALNMLVHSLSAQGKREDKVSRVIESAMSIKPARAPKAKPKLVDAV